MQPLLSVIMPVYNAEKRLKISIESVLAQGYHDFELLLINDGSTDSSGEICDFYSATDKRIKTIHQQNSGVSNARNRGIREARGEYIIFIDSDDTIAQDTFVNLMKCIQTEKLDMLIFGMKFDYYKNGSHRYSKFFSIKEDLDLRKKNISEYFFYLYDKNYLSSSCNKVIRSSLLKEMNIIFEPNMAILEDLKFIIDILQHTNNILAIKNTYYYYFNNLSEPSFNRRPKINYLNNFKILDVKLREFAMSIKMDSQGDIGRINAMIMRYYIIGIEKLFSSNESIKIKFAKLKNYTNDERFKYAVENAINVSNRLKFIRFLLKRDFFMSLFSVFLLNDIYKRILRL